MPLSLVIIGVIITIVMGFGFGSFATMAVYRLPRNMPWIGDKPRCFMCKTPLNIIDYFSVFSYFIHKGKCRYCHKEYEASLGYFITELAITILLVLAFLQFYFSEMFILATGVIVTSVILAVIDAEHKKIPAKVLISLLIIACIYRTYIDQNIYGVIYGGIIGAIIALAIRYAYFYMSGQKEIGLDFTKWQHTDRFVGPGFDYAKLFAICAIFLRPEKLLLFMALNSCIIILWLMIHKKSLRLGVILATTLTVFYICG